MMKAVPSVTSYHLQFASNLENFDENKYVHLNDNVWWWMETNIKGHSSFRSTRSWNYFKGGTSRQSVQSERSEGSHCCQSVKYSHCVLWDSEQRITVLASTSSNLAGRQTRRSVMMRNCSPGHVIPFPVSITSRPRRKANIRNGPTRGREGNHRVRQIIIIRQHEKTGTKC
jgi:hypothetical protein